MPSHRSANGTGLVAWAVFAAALGIGSALQAAAPGQILSVSTNAATIAWRPLGAAATDWDPFLMPYPAPTAYLGGTNGYMRHFQGPEDGELPKLIEAFTYQSFAGHAVSAAVAFAVWGYRVSWFEQRPDGFIYGGSFLVPALWIRERAASGEWLYHEAHSGRYTLSVPVPPRADMQPAVPYRIVVEPLKLLVHQWLDFEDAATCLPSFSPLIPSDITFQPLLILWPKGPKWYYGLMRLSRYSDYAEGQVSSADNMPPLSFNGSPADRSRFHYEGPDLPPLGQPQDEPWLSKVYWWCGQPASKGNGRGGPYWYPVCGTRGYVKRDGEDWESFGAQGPRVAWEAAVSTRPLPFEVVRTSPTNGEHAVKPDTRVEISFSKTLTYLNTGAIRWTDGSGNRVDFGAQADGAQLLMWPRKLLSQNTDYCITIPRGSVRSSTETLGSDFSFAFSTKPYSGGGGGGGQVRPQ